MISPPTQSGQAAGREPLLSIVIPVRNEGLNLQVMLKMLRAVVEVPCEVVVVYDSEDDQSIPIIDEAESADGQTRGVLNNRGVGVINALTAGVEAARGELVLVFAADEVGPILAIDDMLELMLERGCGFVSCTRYAHGGRRLGGSWIGGLLSRTANRLFRRVAGCAFTDATTGIKMFRRELFPRFELSSNPVGWAVAFEMAIKAQLLGLQLGEVPIISIDRLFGGKSTFKLGAWVVEYSRWFVWGWRQLWRAEPGVRRREVVVKLPSVSLEVR